jgi:hypothetical protein
MKMWALPSKVFIPELGVVTHTCNPSTWETEAGELGVQGYPGLNSKTLSILP